MAEWLRRLTRNQLGSARIGSNPTVVAAFYESIIRASLAQSVEHQTFNLRVAGSSPARGFFLDYNTSVYYNLDIYYG